MPPLDPRPQTASPAGARPSATPALPAALKQHSALAKLGRRACESTDLTTFLAEAGSLAAEALGAESFGAGEISGDRQVLTLRFGAIQGPQGIVSAEAVREQRISLKDPTTLFGVALQQGAPLTVADVLATDYRHEPWLGQQPFRGTLVCALGPVDRPYGALAVFTRRPRQFSEGDKLLAEALGGLAASTIARVKAEEALGTEDRCAERIVETGAALVLVLAPDGRIVRCNRATEQVTGFVLDELAGRMLWGAFLIPEEVSQVRAVMERFRKGENEIPFECYVLTKQGQRRRVAWSFAALRNKEGKVEKLVGSGIDISEKCEAIERLEQAQQRAENARQTLIDLQGHLEQFEMKDRSDASQKVEAARSAFSELRAHLAERQRALEVIEPEKAKKTEGLEPHLDLIEGQVADLLNSEAPADTSEWADRRSTPRRPFPYLQVIAPVLDGRLPDRGMFREVRCHDISTGGFSYLSPAEPRHTEIVVAFGSSPRLIYLRTAIAHVSPIMYKGARVFQIGCRYLDRVEISELPAKGKAVKKK